MNKTLIPAIIRAAVIIRTYSTDGISDIVLQKKCLYIRVKLYNMSVGGINSGYSLRNQSFKLLLVSYPFGELIFGYGCTIVIIIKYGGTQYG